MPTCFEKPSTDAWARIRRRDGGRGEAAADGQPSASVGQPQHRTGDSGSAADAICHERLKPPPLDRNVVSDGRQVACRREQLPLPGYALEHVGARSWKAMPESLTRSFTVLDTRTSPASANAATLAPSRSERRRRPDRRYSPPGLSHSVSPAAGPLPVSIYRDRRGETFPRSKSRDHVD